MIVGETAYEGSTVAQGVSRAGSAFCQQSATCCTTCPQWTWPTSSRLRAFVGVLQVPLPCRSIYL